MCDSNDLFGSKREQDANLLKGGKTDAQFINDIMDETDIADQEDIAEVIRERDEQQEIEQSR